MDHSPPEHSAFRPANPNQFCDVCGSMSKLNSVRTPGGRTCHACRNIYNRWRHNTHELKCKSGNNCEVNLKTRTKCTACRFRKAFKVMTNLDFTGNEQWSQIEGRLAESNSDDNDLVSSHVDDDMKNAPSNKSNLLCAICGALACGRNFGTMTCHGCTKFFRKYVNQQAKLDCCEQGSCVINEKTRNNCRFCRFQKCIQAGMRLANKKPLNSGESESGSPEDTVMGSVDSISVCDSQDQEFTEEDSWPAYDPLEKYLNYNNDIPMEFESEEQEDTVLEYVDEDGHTTSLGGTLTNSNSPSFPMGVDYASPVNTFTESLASRNDSSKDSANLMLEDIILFHRESCAFTMDKVSELLNGTLTPAYIPCSNHFEAWHHFAAIMNMELRESFCFLENLDFLQTDQKPTKQTVVLLKHSAFKIYLLRVIRALFPEGMLLQDGRVINCKLLNFMFGEQLVEEMLQISKSIRYGIFTDDDLALFIVMVTLEGIGKFVDEIRDALQSNQALLDLKPKLNTINGKFMNSIVPWLKDNHQSLQLPDVFSEAFDIPWTSPETENVNPQEVLRDGKF